MSPLLNASLLCTVPRGFLSGQVVAVVFKEQPVILTIPCSCLEKYIASLDEYSLFFKVWKWTISNLNWWSYGAHPVHEILNYLPCSSTNSVKGSTSPGLDTGKWNIIIHRADSINPLRDFINISQWALMITATCCCQCKDFPYICDAIILEHLPSWWDWAGNGLWEELFTEVR